LGDLATSQELVGQLTRGFPLHNPGVPKQSIVYYFNI